MYFMITTVARFVLVVTAALDAAIILKIIPCAVMSVGWAFMM